MIIIVRSNKFLLQLQLNHLKLQPSPLFHQMVEEGDDDYVDGQIAHNITSLMSMV